MITTQTSLNTSAVHPLWQRKPLGLTSTATHIHPLGRPDIRYDLKAPLFHGCPHQSTADVQFPLEVGYDLSRVSVDLFRGDSRRSLVGWQPLLPTLDHRLSMGEGGTPLILTPTLRSWAGYGSHCEVRVKDESRNPTWSHKDRLNLCTVSAAVHANAPGIVVASSGNHGASAAAYAARAGLPCIVVMSQDAPPSIQQFLHAYGATLVAADSKDRWAIMQRIVDSLGYYPVSNLTATHTGHPYASEGYKTIAYELALQLRGELPDYVLVPTGYGELLYGVAKGFLEMRALGVTTKLPKLVSCEPAARAPLAAAWEQNKLVARVEPRATIATSVATVVGGVRGTLALALTGGFPLKVADSELREAQHALAKSGIWAELSSAAAVAGLKQLQRHVGREQVSVVCISTSSGIKYHSASAKPTLVCATSIAKELFGSETT